MPKRSKIPENVRLFIVERLAVFDSPKTVAEAIQAEFGLQIARQTVEKYDPTKVNGAEVGAKFREHFYRVREKFRRDLNDIPIANKAVRLRRLDRMERRFEEMGNLLAAAQLLEQAAKEVGGVYVGRGGMIATPEPEGPREPQDLPADHLAEISERFARGLRIVQGGRDDPKDGSTPG